jgi:hypothetical protein
MTVKTSYTAMFYVFANSGTRTNGDINSRIVSLGMSSRFTLIIGGGHSGFLRFN